MSDLERDLALADQLDFFITTVAPQAIKFREELRHQLAKARQLKANGQHEAAEREFDRYVTNQDKLKQLDLKLDEAMAKMLSLRNRHRRRERSRSR